VALELRLDVVDVPPELRFVGLAAALELADDLPAPAAEAGRVPDLQPREASRGAHADDQFAHAGLEPAPFRELELRAHLARLRSGPADRHVGLAAVLLDHVGAHHE